MFQSGVGWWDEQDGQDGVDHSRADWQSRAKESRGKLGERQAGKGLRDQGLRDRIVVRGIYIHPWILSTVLELLL